MDAKEIGKRVANLRTKREMTRNKLATKAGVSPTYIYQVENGEKCPTVEYLEYICFGLGITLCEFFADDGRADSFNDGELFEKIKKLTVAEKQALMTLLK